MSGSVSDLSSASSRSGLNISAQPSATAAINRRWRTSGSGPAWDGPKAILVFRALAMLIPLGIARLTGRHVLVTIPNWTGALWLVLAAGLPWCAYYAMAALWQTSWREWSVEYSPWIWAHYVAVTIVSLIFTRAAARRLVVQQAKAAGLLPPPRLSLMKRVRSRSALVLKVLVAAIAAVALLAGFILSLGDILNGGLRPLNIVQLATLTAILLGILWAIWRRVAAANHGDPALKRPVMIGSVLSLMLIGTLIVQLLGVSICRRMESHYVRQYVSKADPDLRQTRLADLREWVLNELDCAEAELAAIASK